ncbi:toxin-activating lysine-acyltransferase [Sphingomonas sp. MMS24-J13]|uniref:toxin-activating lysine-acyltransferase n=1 Tax=Sphingomonas sp. MMS24-J13 TaxID=3238686 RepID=UPI00384E3D92
MLGEITWLLTQSPVHKQLFIGDLEWFCMPPLMLEQFRLFYGPSTPAAVAIWAFVSDEADERLEAGGYRLRADEWKSGDNLWLIELVAPFGAQEEILLDLSRNVFPDRSFKFHRIGSGGKREVASYEPAPAHMN